MLSFKYLGSVMNKYGTHDEDVNHRISIGWLKWMENSSIFCDEKIPPKLKGQLYTTAIRPALTYGANCWTLNDKYEKDLETAGMERVRMCR